MKRAVLAGEALADDFGVLVNQNGHGWLLSWTVNGG
jgi:hypothetical protein